MKRLTAIALVILLMLPVFAGGAKEVKAAEESSGTAENPVIITCVIKDLSDYTEMLAHIESALAKEGTYIKFQPVEIQEGSYSDAVSLLLQSGTIPDLIYFQGGDYQFGVTQGILEDLRPYVAASKNLKNTLGDHSKARLENYPYLLWNSTPGNKVPLVRKDWFDQTVSGKALLENPTVENYYTFMKELKEKFTTKTVFTCQGATDGLYELDMVFGQAFGNSQSWVKDENGNYVYKNVTANELKKLEFYAKLYKEGLFDNEYLTKKYSAKEQAFYTGEAGIVVGTQNTVVPKYENKMIAANGESASLVVLPPAKGEDGVEALAPVAVDKETRGWAISKYSEHKQLVFDILDWLAGGEGALLDQYGFEGVHYTIEDGKLNIIDNNWWPRFHESLKDYSCGMEITGDLPLSEKPIMAEATEMATKCMVLDNAFSIPDELSTEWDAATLVYKEFAADFVAGKKTAADWDAFVKEWYAMGGRAVTEYANSVLK